LRLLILIFIITITAIFSCSNAKEKETAAKAPTISTIDYPEIEQRGKLIALTGYNAISYFIYKGQSMGYEYELLQRLCKDLNLELEIKLIKSLDSMFIKLNRGEGDIIAHNLTVTKERLQKAAFSKRLNVVFQVLVQRKPRNWRKMKLHEIEKQLIRSPLDLIGKKITIRKSSVYYKRLQNLSDEIGGNIDIIPMSTEYSVSDLIRMVDRGEIEYTIADNNIAELNSAYYKNIDVNTKISLPQRTAWAVRKTSPLLLEKVNNWLQKIKKTADFQVIYNKYFTERNKYKKRMHSEYLSLTGGKISKYDPIIKQYAQKINWDWRLLASLIYQESKFNPREKSWIGAVGLMQLLPKTARHFEARNIYNPNDNIKAGVNFIRWLQNYWKDIPDSLERIKFVLASYNTGQGHVRDAQALAKKYGKNPLLWDDNTAYYLLMKSHRKYFDDPVVKFGYCRGEEPVNYVSEILKRYSVYKKFISLLP